MCALGMMRAAVAALLLGPSLVIADGTEPAAPSTQPMPVQAAPAASPVVMPPAPMWLQVLPLAAPQLYWGPSPGIAWPVAPQYPAPIPIPYPAYAVWRPIVWMLVPMTALAPASAPMPAGVDYGPVADAPVVELPLSDATPDTASVPVPAAAEGAMPAPAVSDPAKPAEESAAEAPALELPVSAGVDRSPQAADVPTAVVPASLTLVDYGPVTPTPVVDLLALERQAAAPRPRKQARGTPKPAQQSVRKSAGTAAPVSSIPATAQPARKRLCWNKGVVAPCR